MLRKNIRMRREYLYNMENEKKAKAKYNDKMKIKNAQISNKSLPTELYKKSDQLQKEINANDENNIIPRSHIDDEYATQLYREPSILLTTCRDPSSRLTQFMKELALVIPNCIRINRGGYVIKDLNNMCIEKNITDLVILHEHRGKPDGMIVSHFPLGPTIYFGIEDCVLRHDLKEKLDTVSEAYPHMIINNINTPLGERVTSILKNLFPVPKQDSKRVITMHNNSDTLSIRNHSYVKTDYKTVELNELGPRFELKPYQIVLGTIDQKEATKEWVLRPYMNTATKRKAL